MNSLREMDFVSSASYSCSFELLKIQIVCAGGEFMNSRRRSSELFCVFSEINGEMALIQPIVHYFYREFLYFLEISQSPPIFLMVLQTPFERWADSLEHSVGVLHISTQWQHTEDSLNVFPAGPVNGRLQRLKAPESMTPLLLKQLPPDTPLSPPVNALNKTLSSKFNCQHSIKVSEYSPGELHRKYQDLPLSSEQRAQIRLRTCCQWCVASWQTTCLSPHRPRLRN